MKRILDILFSSIGLFILFPLFLLLFVIGAIDTGSPLFLQKRIGLNKKNFYLIKFRSMFLDTESVSTHMVKVSSITKWGFFIRKTKLDELPQLINVLKGDMSFVGPRPNLISQNELMFYRSICNVYSVKPGITGLAQIRKIDMSTPQLLAETDREMISQLSIFNYFKYILLTIIGNGMGDRIKP